jgi:ankyrin repeat protein
VNDYCYNFPQSKFPRPHKITWVALILASAFKNACHNGHIEVVAALLADKRVKPADADNVAFSTACHHGHSEVVK